VDEVAARASTSCAPLLANPDRCALPADDACAQALVAVFAALREKRPALPERRAAAADAVATELFDVASRLGLARAAIARGACQRIAPAGAHPTEMRLAMDGRSIVARPLTALRAGRRYAVVAQGLAPDELAQLRETLVPKPAAQGLTVPPDVFAATIARGLPDDAGGIATARVTSFVGKLEREAATMPGLGPFTGVRVTLPTPVRPEQLGTLQLAFVPVSAARAEETLGVFTVLDARASLLEDRARLAMLACDPSVAEPRETKATFGNHLPHVARLVHGRLRSLDVICDAAGGAAPLGVSSADARPVALSYLLALPHDYGPDTPLVLMVDGHGGSAERIMGKYADQITARGLAVLSIDLPAHGERSVAGTDFLDALDPAALGRTFRQAAIDVVAVVQAATRCGLLLPDGDRVRVHEVRYFGYSLGAMVGAIARSVEPALGTSALVAPGGDILGWLMLRVTPDFGASYVTCLGGPQEGESCIDDGRCVAPGSCIVDPYSERLCGLITLPYELAAAAGDPLSYVTHRTGTASKGRLLVVTAGEDAALHPALATRLADAYGMRPVAPHRRRGPRSQLVQWPDVGHELLGLAGVREQVFEFLASNGRRTLAPPVAAGQPQP